MRTWDLHTPVAKLHQAMKDLEVTKDRISDQWQDDKLREFDDNFLEPLRPILSGTVTAITELADILHQADLELRDY